MLRRNTIAPAGVYDVRRAAALRRASDVSTRRASDVSSRRASDVSPQAPSIHVTGQQSGRHQPSGQSNPAFDFHGELALWFLRFTGEPVKRPRVMSGGCLRAMRAHLHGMIHNAYYGIHV